MYNWEGIKRTFPTFKMQKIATVPIYNKMDGTAPTCKMHNIGTVPMFKMHNRKPNIL